MTLTEFLLARIAEDEARADRLPLQHPEGPPEGRPYWQDTMGHPVYEPRTKVLAECEAKRRIVERYLRWLKVSEQGEAKDGWAAGALFATITDLALPYADHPDYREEWRP